MGDFHSPMQIKRRPSVSDRPHHQTCVGAAKAEAVVQYGLHLPLFGYMGNEIHASAILARVIQVQRWWHDLVAHRQHAEYGLDRSEEHTSELQSLMRISYDVFCLKKKKTI